ncbi:DegT/DnrJ/EryC1/StrS family aminotransferase [bacterium]|nr:DegT/DnrJ/EryC1/StrS family aminotransferase [bacterium]
MHEWIPVSRPVLNENCRRYVLDCVDTAWISSAGAYIKRFEKMNADYYGTGYGVAVANGTVALHLALAALDIGSGDEVIVPDLTFAATANAVVYTGAEPVLADVEPDFWTIDIDRCEALVTERTRAIMPVHLYGQPCRMDRVTAFAEKHGLYVVEDCAEAHGASFQGKKTGSFGDISCFSFYGNKIITTGEGGVCLTSDPDLHAAMRILRDHGKEDGAEYLHARIGHNYRMTNMQAAIGCAQMEDIDAMLARREELRARYDSHFLGSDLVVTQAAARERGRVCWLYSLLLDRERTSVPIAHLQQELKKRNIDSRPFFTPLHMMEPYRRFRHASPRESARIHEAGISLPTAVDMTEEQIDYICAAVLEIAAS